MSQKVGVTSTYLRNIGNALRYKLNEQTGYRPSEMADAILRISGGQAGRCPRTEQTTVYDYVSFLDDVSFTTNAYEEQ